MMPAATSGSVYTIDPSVLDVIYVIVGLVVLFAFIVASRLIARFAADQLRRRHVRSDMVVVSRRVVTFAVIILGIFAAFGFALQSANVALFGILLATVVAAFGVQDLLKDYVSGYYVLLERHVRVGDRIGSDTWSGTITEMRLRVTLLKSDAGDLIIVPNSEMFNKPITIYSRQPVPPETPEPKPALPK
jgi:small conductance mechanosensitive channel